MKHTIWNLMAFLTGCGLLMLLSGGMPLLSLGLSAVGAAALMLSRTRPVVATTVAWLATIGVVGQHRVVPSWDASTVTLAAFAVAALMLGIHRPSRQAPPITWAAPAAGALIVAVAAAVAWGPRIAMEGASVARLDPATAAGMAIRSLAAGATLAALLAILWLFSSMRSKVPERAPASHDAEVGPL